MTIRFPTPVRNGMLGVLSTVADAGSGPATMKVYAGGQPANGDLVPPGTLLVTFVLAEPAFSTPAAGVIAVDADPDISAVAATSGTAGWARITNSNNETVLDGTVGTSGDFVINTTAIVQGATVILAAASFTYPI